MSITVAEEGNRRVGAMSREEVAQCVTDICNWFDKFGALAAPRKAPLETLAKTLEFDVPDILFDMWTEADGGVWFGEKQLLSTSDAQKALTKVEDGRDYLPFAADVDGALLVVDAGSPGQAVYEWDEDGMGAKLSSSLLNFFEEMRNNLLSGRFEFVEEVGVIESDNGGK